MNSFVPGWYLIYTRPRYEKKVHNHLTESNLTSFLPTRKVLRSWHDRRKYIDEPLFPSYVFIYLPIFRNYFEGLEADGALHYVRTGRQISRVSETVVNNVKLLTQQSLDLEVSDVHFQSGRKLVISDGPLTGLACEVVQSEGRSRLLVRVDLLNRNILVTIPKESLMAI
jgi:transcription antitermination factor NusG